MSKLALLTLMEGAKIVAILWTCVLFNVLITLLTNLNQTIQPTPQRKGSNWIRKHGAWLMVLSFFTIFLLYKLSCAQQFHIKIHQRVEKLERIVYEK